MQSPVKICSSLLINLLVSGGPPLPGGPPPPGTLPPPGSPPPDGDLPPPPDGPPGTHPPDIPGPNDVNAMLVLLICAGVVIVVVMSLDSKGIDSANAAILDSSMLSGGSTTIFSVLRYE